MDSIDWTPNDRYALRLGDVVIEAAGAGVDTGRTTLAAYPLTVNVENLVATNAIAHTLVGNALANSITGNGAADSLLGGDGADTLNGGAGADTQVGGAGQDVLIGGLGNDQFLYTAVGDSLPLAADEMTDFTAGQDKIDLRLIDGNAATPLTYVAGEPTAAGQVGVVSLVGTAWQIQIDVNGGGVGATINITSATAPNATWFLL